MSDSRENSSIKYTVKKALSHLNSLWSIFYRQSHSQQNAYWSRSQTVDCTRWVKVQSTNKYKLWICVSAELFISEHYRNAWELNQHAIALGSQARPTSAKEGKGLVNCVYNPCLAALYSAVQSHCSILSHDTLCHCLSSNSSLKNGKRVQGHLFRYCRSWKNTSTIVLGVRAYSTTGNSRGHYLKSSYVIQLIADSGGTWLV